MTDDLIHLLRTWPAEHTSDVALLNEAADALEGAKRETLAVAERAFRAGFSIATITDMSEDAAWKGSAIRAALSGERQEGEGSMNNRIEYDENGELDEVVTDSGMHLERMSKKGWFLSGHRADGTSIAIWFRGKITMIEERPAPRAQQAKEEPK